MKRRERKHLKEDELVSTLTKIIRFLKRWQRELKIAAFSLLALLMIIVVIRTIQVRGGQRANQDLAQIMKLQAALKAKATTSEEKPAELSELEKIAGRGKFTRLAYLYLANYWVERNDLAQARAWLEKFPERPKDIFYFQAKDLLGQVLTWQKEFDGALELFNSLEKEVDEIYPLEVVLIHSAEALEQKGDKTQAIAKYRQVQEQNPQAAFFWNLNERIRRLGG